MNLQGSKSQGLRNHVSNLALVLALLLAAPAAWAQTLTGSVKDGTTDKPSAGDEVILLSLGQGMEESGHTKSDVKGNFSFKLDKAGSPHLVKVIHQDAEYFRMAPPGTTSVAIDVYDVGKKIEGIEVVADVMRIQVEQGQLEIMRQFAVQNTSKPPRTQKNDHNLEFYVPEGAQVVGGSATTEGGRPLNSIPVAEDDKKTRYAFSFPLRPGTTLFEVAYQLPYSGSANVDPKSIYPLQHFVVMLPKTMQFSGVSGANYQVTPYPKEPDTNVQVVSDAKAGQSLAFKLSGEGTLQAAQENAGAPSEGGSGQSAQNENRPGGGLGPPIDAPPPLQRYQWWILGGFAVVLVAGGVFVASQQQAANRAAARANSGDGLQEDAAGEFEELQDLTSGAAPANSTPRPETRPQPSAASASTASMLMQGLKDELFELEIEHKQGRISQQEYEKTKAALDQTLERALKRAAQKA